MKDPPHNRFKAPFYALIAGIFVVLVVLDAIAGKWVPTVFWVVCAVGAVMAFRLARSERNPRWFRSFLDR